GSSANAAGSTTKTSTNEVGQGSIRKDVLMVTGVSGHTINGKHKDGTTVNVITTTSTTFTRDGVSVSLSAVKVGEIIGVVGSSNDAWSNSATHVEILVPEKPGPASDTAVGSITSITGTTITIQNDGKVATIRGTTTSRFGDKREGKQVTLADLKVGDFVYAVGTLNGDGSLTADVVVIVNPPGQS